MLTDAWVGAEVETSSFDSEGHCVFCRHIVAGDLHPKIGVYSWWMSGNLLVDEELVRLVISLEYISSCDCFTQVIRAWCSSDGVNGSFSLSYCCFLQLVMNLYV